MTPLVIYAATVLLWAVPLWQLLPRVGLSRGWAVLSVIPLVAFPLLWLIAFRPWHPQDTVETFQ